MMRNQLFRSTRFALLLCTFTFAASTRAARAQLVYNHTTFVAGFGSGPEIWTRGYSDISGDTPPSYLSRSINLNTVGYANVDSSLRYDQLVGRVGSFVAAGGQHVLVGHSLGALIARGTYISNSGVRPNIAAIIAIAAPHEGAPIADNAAEAVRFFGDVQRRVNDGLTAANFTFEVWSLFAPPSVQPLFVAFASFVLYKTAGQQIDLGNLLDIPKVPALQDLSPSSTAIQTLTGMDDASIPRANIYGTIPFQNAAFRIKYSLDNNDAGLGDAIAKRNEGLTLFKACKYIGYATIVLGGQARKCAYATKVIQRIDERWAKYVNGSDGNGNPRYVPFDGIVPNERSRYPSPNGVAYEYDVNGVDHQNIYKTRAGLDHVALAMARIGMVPVGGGGGGGGGQPLTASISGPDVVNTDWYSTWSAGASGGTPPYTYSWSGLFYGGGSSVSGTTSSGGDLTLDVYDAASGHVTITKTVSSTGCSGQYLC